MFLTKASGEFAIVVDGKIKDDADYIEYPEVRIGDQTFKRVRVNESLNRYLRQDLRRHHATFGLVNQRRFVWIVLIVYFFNTPLISFNAGVFILGTLFYAGILVFVLRQARWRVKWINVDGEEIHRE